MLVEKDRIYDTKLELFKKLYINPRVCMWIFLNFYQKGQEKHLSRF